MRSETTARLFHAAITVAVFAVILSPAASAIFGSDENGSGIEISTGAEYDVQEMDAECLAYNISEAVSGRQGCSVIYGEYSDPVDGASARAVAEKVIKSGALKARIFDADGNLAAQKAIRYSDAVSVRAVMDVRIPQAVAKISDVGASLRFSGSDISVPAASATRTEGNILRLDFTVPYVAAYAAFALGCGTVLEIDLNYGSSVKVSAEMSADVQTAGFGFSTRGSDADIISGISAETGIPVLSWIGVAPDSSGKIGSFADYTMSGGTLTISGRNSPPSVSLEKSLEKYGDLTVSSGSVSAVMPGETSEGLIKALQSLETLAGGF